MYDSPNAKSRRWFFLENPLPGIADTDLGPVANIMPNTGQVTVSSQDVFCSGHLMFLYTFIAGRKCVYLLETKFFLIGEFTHEDVARFALPSWGEGAVEVTANPAYYYDALVRSQLGGVQLSTPKLCEECRVPMRPQIPAWECLQCGEIDLYPEVMNELDCS